MHLRQGERSWRIQEAAYSTLATPLDKAAGSGQDNVRMDAHIGKSKLLPTIPDPSQRPTGSSLLSFENSLLHPTSAVGLDSNELLDYITVSVPMSL